MHLWSVAQPAVVRRLARGHRLIKAMGADEIAAANSAMQAIGCIGARICNTNHCPAELATLKPEFRRGHRQVGKAARDLPEDLGRADASDGPGVWAFASESIQPRRHLDIRLAARLAVRHSLLGLPSRPRLMNHYHCLACRFGKLFCFQRFLVLSLLKLLRIVTGTDQHLSNMAPNLRG